jgi:hypothetical protein
MKEIDQKTLQVEYRYAAISGDGQILDFYDNKKGYSKEETVKKNLDNYTSFITRVVATTIESGDLEPTWWKSLAADLKSAKIVKIKISYEVAS